MNVAGLFAGIGGLELGFSSSEYNTKLLCEIDPVAQEVLKNSLMVSRLLVMYVISIDWKILISFVLGFHVKIYHQVV